MSTAKDTLSRAAEIIEQRGHCKNVNMDANGCVCMFGAIGVASFGDAYGTDREKTPEQVKTYADAVGAVRDHMKMHDLTDSFGWVTIASFNDAPERTPEEVTALLRAVEA